MIDLDKAEAAAIYADALELAEAVLASLPDEPDSRQLLSTMYIAAHDLASAAARLTVFLNQLARNNPEILRTLERHAERIAGSYHPRPTVPPASTAPVDHIRAAIAEAYGPLPDADTFPDQLAAVAQAEGIPLHAVVAWIHDRPRPELSAAHLRAWARRNGFLHSEPAPSPGSPSTPPPRPRAE